MTEATTTIEVDKAADVDTTKTVETKAVETKVDTTKAADTKVADTTKATTETTTAEAAKEEAKSPWGDNWRDDMAGGDDDVAKAIARYSSPKALARALKEAQATISAGKTKTVKPDASDEKAMAEWRKAEGIPPDPTGYKIPEAIQKRMVDEDKPILSNFTEYAHKKDAPPAFVEMASEWYVEMAEAGAAKQAEDDKAASEQAEDTLRKDWAHGEYKANSTIAKRWIESVPGLGAKWAEARVDGRRLGDIPEFFAWAADQGREKFGDVSFTTSDSEKRHTAEKEELETLMRTDIDKYYETGADKKYAAVLEKELKRRK